MWPGGENTNQDLVAPLALQPPGIPALPSYLPGSGCQLAAVHHHSECGRGDHTAQKLL